MGLPLAGGHLIRVVISNTRTCETDAVSFIRDFLLRISCRRMIDSNSKCQVISNFKNDGSEPVVDVVFSKHYSCVFTKK